MQQATPVTAYRKLATMVPPPTLMPIKNHATQSRPKRQCKAFREAQIVSDSEDTPFNPHQLASDMPDLVPSICTHPDLVCVHGNTALLEELDRALLIDSSSAQLLPYNTTFQLGNFYISPLVYYISVYAFEISRKQWSFQFVSLYMKGNLKHDMKSSSASAASLCHL